MSEPEYFDPRSSLNLHWRQRDTETRAIARKNIRIGIKSEVRKAAKKKWNGIKTLSVTLTMKQVINGLQVGYSDAVRELTQFLIRLNRKLLKRTYRDGHKRLKCTGNAEIGDANGGWHLHCQIEWLNGWA